MVCSKIPKAIIGKIRMKVSFTVISDCSLPVGIDPYRGKIRRPSTVSSWTSKR